jgi:hypothetical protein
MTRTCELTPDKRPAAEWCSRVLAQAVQSVEFTIDVGNDNLLAVDDHRSQAAWRWQDLRVPNPVKLNSRPREN